MSDELHKLLIEVVIILYARYLFVGIVNILINGDACSLSKLVCNILISEIVLIINACAYNVCRGKTRNGSESRINKNNVLVNMSRADNLSKSAALNCSLDKLSPLGDISLADGFLILIIIGANEMSILALANLLRNTLADKELDLVGHGMIGNRVWCILSVVDPLHPEITGSGCAVCQKKTTVRNVFRIMLHKGNGSKLELKSETALGKSFNTHLLRDLRGKLSCHFVNEGLGILTCKECRAGRCGMNVYFNKTALAIYASANYSRADKSGNSGREIKDNLLIAAIGIRDEVGEAIRVNRPGYPMSNLLLFENNCHRIVEHSVEQKVVCKVILIHLNTKHAIAVDLCKRGNEICFNAAFETVGDGIAHYLVME